MIPLAIIPGSVLTASVETYYTVPTTDQKLKGVKLTSLRVVNTDTVSRTFTAYVVPRGSSASLSNVRFSGVSIPAGMSLSYDISDVMLPGTSIQALASATTVVSLSASGESFP